jgi:hypothetical protein
MIILMQQDRCHIYKIVLFRVGVSRYRNKDGRRIEDEEDEAKVLVFRSVKEVLDSWCSSFDLSMANLSPYWCSTGGVHEMEVSSLGFRCRTWVRVDTEEDFEQHHEVHASTRANCSPATTSKHGCEHITKQGTCGD